MNNFLNQAFNTSKTGELQLNYLTISFIASVYKIFKMHLILSKSKLKLCTNKMNMTVKFTWVTEILGIPLKIRREEIIF